MGEMYVDYYGEMIFENVKSKETAVVNIQPRSKQVSGFIKNKKGEIQFDLKGSWDSHIYLQNHNQEIILWQNQNTSYKLYYLDINTLSQLDLMDTRLRKDVAYFKQANYTNAQTIYQQLINSNLTPDKLELKYF